VAKFDDSTKQPTEMDALVAYLQMLGTLVKFTDVRLEDIRQ
jgi:cytochrome c oxidase cbb3-type subunit 2